MDKMIRLESGVSFTPIEYTFRQYHEDATKTADYPARGDNFVYPALGAAEEAGEIAGKAKKLWRNHGLTGLNRPEGAPVITDPAVIKLYEGFLKEIGDCLWYLDAACFELGTTLEEIAKLNVAKLADRHERSVIKSIGDDR